jgi:hypothetical protein
MSTGNTFHSLLFSVLTTHLQYVVITYITQLLMDDDTYYSPIYIGSLPVCKARVELGGFSTCIYLPRSQQASYQVACNTYIYMVTTYITNLHM